MGMFVVHDTNNDLDQALRVVSSARRWLLQHPGLSVDVLIAGDPVRAGLAPRSALAWEADKHPLLLVGDAAGFMVSGGDLRFGIRSVTIANVGTLLVTSGEMPGPVDWLIAVPDGERRRWCCLAHSGVLTVMATD